MSKYIIYLYTNHSALNVKQQYTALLEMFDPESLPRYQKHLHDMSLDYSKYVNIAHIGNVKTHEGISVLENKITINYEQSRITGQTVQPPWQKQLIIEYRIRNGRFWIVEMAERELAQELEEQENE